MIPVQAKLELSAVSIHKYNIHIHLYMLLHQQLHI